MHAWVQSYGIWWQGRPDNGQWFFFSVARTGKPTWNLL